MAMEQIEKEKIDYANRIIDSFGVDGVPDGISNIRGMIADGFKAGVQFAISHQWVRVEDRIPPSSCVLVCKDKWIYTLCVYIGGRFMMYNKARSYKQEFHPTHWMKIPQLNL